VKCEEYSLKRDAMTALPDFPPSTKIIAAEIINSDIFCLVSAENQGGSISALKFSLKSWKAR